MSTIEILVIESHHDTSPITESFTSKLEKARSIRDSTASPSSTELSTTSTQNDTTQFQSVVENTDASPLADQLAIPSQDTLPDVDLAVSAMDTTSSTKRAHRRESTTESINSDTIATKMLKTDQQSNSEPTSNQEDILKEISQYLQSNPNIEEKLQMKIQDFEELLSDLRKNNVNNMVQTILPTYTKDITTLANTLDAIRPLLTKDKSLKNRITRLVKKCTSSLKTKSENGSDSDISNH